MYRPLVSLRVGTALLVAARASHTEPSGARTGNADPDGGPLRADRVAFARQSGCDAD
jgi:hypothetical protein